MFFIGIDGGGTKTEFVLTNENGLVLFRLIKKGSNPNDCGLENSYMVLANGISEALRASGISANDVFIFAGISGAGSGDNANKLQNMLSKNYPHINVQSDLANALEVCLKGENGVAVICGTGISCSLYKDGERKTIGGYGYLFEDGGSGYAYGRDCVKAALKARDGYGKKTCLRNLIFEKFSKDVWGCLPDLLLGGKKAVASLCPLVFAGLAMGDEVCAQIVEENLAATVELLKNALTIYNEKQCKISFIGGLTREQLFRERMKKEFGAQYSLVYTNVTPVYGAVRLAVLFAGEKITKEFEQNYINSIQGD